MEHRFKAEEWSKLTPPERVRRCQFMAREAQTLAKRASPELAIAYLKIAESWGALADEIDRHAKV